MSRATRAIRQVFRHLVSCWRRTGQNGDDLGRAHNDQPATPAL